MGNCLYDPGRERPHYVRLIVCAVLCLLISMAIPSLATAADPLLPNETTLPVVPVTTITLPTVVTPETTLTPIVTTTIPITTTPPVTTIVTLPITTVPVTTIVTPPITTLPVTTLPITTVTTIRTQPTVTITTSSHTPPSLLVNPPTINQLKITVDGTSTPGELGQTITRISWNWGDGRIEEGPSTPGPFKWNLHLLRSPPR